MGCELLTVGEERAGVLAVMCSESLWWRCHRRLLADHLTLVRGCTVHHLGHDGRRTPPAPTDTARPCGADVCYPPPQPAFTLR